MLWLLQWILLIEAQTESTAAPDIDLNQRPRNRVGRSSGISMPGGGASAAPPTFVRSIRRLVAISFFLASPTMFIALAIGSATAELSTRPWSLRQRSTLARHRRSELPL